MEQIASPVVRAIEALGGPTKASSKLGLKNPSVAANWISRGRVPADKVIEVETFTGISRHELRPDVFGALPSSQGDRSTPPAGADAQASAPALSGAAE